MSGEEVTRTIEETLARHGLSQAGLAVSKTLERSPLAPAIASTLPAISIELGSVGLSSTETGGLRADLVARRELGRGGMGVVYLAQQRSLAREVAIKTMLKRDEPNARALVREAQILGSLEHPNLVPLHALGVDGEGNPVLVMKRVEGASWRALLRDPQHEGWKPLLRGHGDPLRANIEILLQVCHAISFAHEHGVIHRDLKPDNVLIGRFGEVYLVDWGVALRLSERETEAPGLVGTLGYLAPEMARADPRLVDERTDVYLLGGALYEVLTGHMPHEAPTLLAALVASVTGLPPPIPDGVPGELVALTRAAMVSDKTARLPSAEAFRDGLRQYLLSREADVLVDDARRSLELARAAMRREGAASGEAFRTLIEARFGLSSARRVRPHDEAIATLLDATVQALVERELALRSPATARAFLAELPNPAVPLQRALEALEAEVARERGASEQLERKRRQSDATLMVGPLSKALVYGWALLAPFGLWNVWRAVERGQGFQPSQAVTFDLTLLGVLAAIFFSLRRTLFATPRNGSRIDGLPLLGTGHGSGRLGHFRAGWRNERRHAAL